MKSIIALCLLVTGLAPAATVSIDFEDGTPFSSDTNIIVESKGYTFETFGWNSPLEASVSADGIYYQSAAFGPAPGGGFYSSITMTRDDGAAFSMLSLDASGGSFFGRLTDGNQANLNVAVGTGDWLSLTTLVYSVNAASGQLMELSLDNVVVSAVPVPGAVWLFGSGVALLGWMRRRQTQ